MPLAVKYDEKEHCWWTPIFCDVCGGYRHDLPLSDPEAENEALFAAEAAHNYPNCLGCESLAAAALAPVGSGDSLLWWDAQAREWMLWLPLADTVAGVTLPLGVHHHDDKGTAEVAARILMGENPLSLQIVEEGHDGDADLPYLRLSNQEHRYELWLPCFECNGILIPIRSQDTVLTAVNEVLECYMWLQAYGCPRCRTLREHDNAILEKEPLSSWYDTVIHDWVMRMPDGNDKLQISALRINRYGVSNESVLSAIQQQLLLHNNA